MYCDLLIIFIVGITFILHINCDENRLNNLTVQTVQTSDTGVNSINFKTNKSRISDAAVQTKCIMMRKKFRVEPGTSWGNMDEKMQKKWMILHCDRFFCEKNKLEGLGIYKCIPVGIN
jgi:hypothetical protein